MERKKEIWIWKLIALFHTRPARLVKTEYGLPEMNMDMEAQ